MARFDLADARLLVDSSLAARLPVEVLHRIGQIDGCSIDAGLGERVIEHAACRPDKRVAGEIFVVAGLLADEHDGGAPGPSPNTACVALAKSGHARQVWAAFARAPSERAGGTGSAADLRLGGVTLDLRHVAARR